MELLKKYHLEGINLRKVNEYREVVHIEDLQIGDEAFINETVNKIKKIDDDQFILKRFDSITSLPFQHSSDYSTKKVAELLSKLDHSVKYADDRVQLVNNLLGDNQWLYDLLSDHSVVSSRIKRKTDLQAEEQFLDRLLDGFSTYMSRPKFNNQEDEKQFLTAKSHLESKAENQLTQDEIDRILNIIHSLRHKNIRQDLTKHSNKKYKSKDDSRIEWTDNFITVEEKGLFLNEGEVSRYKKINKKQIRNLDELNNPIYWDKMNKYSSDVPFFSGKTFKFKDRYLLLHSLKKEIDNLNVILGYNIEDKEKKKAHIETLITKVGKRNHGLIVDAYKQLKGDYSYAIKALTTEISFNSIPRSSSVINYYQDTWITDHSGTEKLISKNRVLLHSPEFYKGFLLNYKELKLKYDNDHKSSLWGFLKTFEEIMKKTDFTDEELFVLELVLDNFEQKQIRDLYKKKNLGNLSARKISYMINTSIPNKMVGTYLELVDNWLYTYKIKGIYKRCTKCKKTKLISNDRYFGRKKDSRDGFKNTCKQCLKQKTVQKM